MLQVCHLLGIGDSNGRERRCNQQGYDVLQAGQRDWRRFFRQLFEDDYGKVLDVQDVPSRSDRGHVSCIRSLEFRR